MSSIIKKYFGKSPAVIKSALDRYPRKQLAHDDVLDALVNAVTAARLDASMEMLPPEPLMDMLGPSHADGFLAFRAMGEREKAISAQQQSWGV